MAVQESEIKLSRQGATLPVYFRGGEGPWVLMVNGHTRPGTDFRAFMRYLEEHGYRSATLDNRGAGGAEVQSPFSRQDMVDDIRAVAESLDIERAHVLGISMGGVLAQEFAARNPTLIESLALVSTTCSQDYLSGDDSPWENDLDKVVAKMRPYFSERFFAKNKILINAMCKQILKNVASGNFAEGAAMQKAAMDDYDTTAVAPQIGCPTVIFHGDSDEIIRPAVVDQLEALIPDTKRIIYEGVGHLLLAECPKQLYGDYVGFLGDVGN